ncbi:MAG: hypothetical protein ACPHID_00100 [Thermoplasmatota archaeon]
MSVRGPDWKPKLSDPEVQAYLFEEVGEEALEMARYMEENNPISGVDIVEHFEDRKPSDVRKVLYRLMEAHAAEYEKETDSSGWETFIWNLDLPEIGLILRRRWADELASLRKQIQFEQDHEFYACPQLHRRIIFEDAMDIGFQCPVCQEPMAPVDNGDIIAKMQERVDELAPAFQD